VDNFREGAERKELALGANLAKSQSAGEEQCRPIPPPDGN